MRSIHGFFTVGARVFTVGACVCVCVCVFFLVVVGIGFRLFGLGFRVLAKSFFWIGFC